MTLIPFPGQFPWTDVETKGLPTQTFKQYLSQLDNIVRLIVSGGGVPRIVLAAPTDFYVDPTNGFDSNPGTLAAPFKTLNHAMTVLASIYDFGGQAVTVHLLNNGNDANGSGNMDVVAWTGGGQLILDGGGHSLTHTGRAQNADGCLFFKSGFISDFTYQNITLNSAAKGQTQSNSNLQWFTPAVVRMGPGVVFDTSQDVHIRHLVQGGFHFMQNDFTIGIGGVGSGNANALIAMASSEGGVAGSHITIHFANNVTFGTLVNVSSAAALNFSGISWNPEGRTISGQSYSVSSAAFLAGAALIPGTAGVNNGGFLG